ncbi:MAG TPA: OmpA family protein [Spirochaetota bacterium]|nr:OmpA family protein [Spirochaetota bacterium]HPJ34013.1 OmpA family protein [Spirochaetota bacterium]
MAKKKKREKNVPKGPPPWMVTMGDMNNLLMCFFIILMGDETIATADDYKMIINSFRGNLGIMEGGSSVSRGKMAEMGHNVTALPSTQKNKALGKKLAKAQEAFKAEVQARYISIREDERGLIISLASDFFFDPGSAALREEMFPVLAKVGNILRNVPNFVRIEGHTDNRPVSQAMAKEGFKTNWYLSSARSLSVLQHLAEEESVEPRQVSSAAYGEFRPIEDNNTPEGRAYNRRVDIVILKERYLQETKDRRINRPLPDEEWDWR